MVIEGFWLKTKSNVYKEIYQFLIKIFAVTFGMGVVTGVVMSYQFGTNWSVFSDKVSNIIGPLIGYEVLTAFFLEAGFLGIMLFGWNKVSNRVHFFATCMVAIGTLFSVFWIMSANSWMHTPTGYVIGENGIFYPKNWIDIIFNPSFLHRFFHMVFAAFITTAFAVSGIAAYLLYKGKSLKHAKIMITMSLFLAFIFVPIQVYIGDSLGRNTLKYQPAKIAAIEGIWDTQKSVPWTIIGWPNEKKLKTEYAIDIPYASSIILTHTLDGEVRGLKSWPEKDRPPVLIPFFGFRIMIATTGIMLLIACAGVYLFFKKKLFTLTTFHKVCIWVSPIGFITILAGWYTTEVGRQPYVVYGLLRTSDSISPVALHDLMFSFTLFVIVYFFITSFGIYYIFKLIVGGVEEGGLVKKSSVNMSTSSFKQIFLRH
jgi:cytochrome d ubiquinol oxidase subunit I